MFRDFKHQRNIKFLVLPDLQVTQTLHTGILLLPGQAGHEREKQATSREVPLLTVLPPVALEKEKPPRILGLGNVFSEIGFSNTSEPRLPG